MGNIGRRKKRQREKPIWYRAQSPSFPLSLFEKNKTIRFAEEFETRQLAVGKKALKMKFDPTAIFKRTAVATCAKMEEGGKRKNSRGGLSLKGNRGERSKLEIGSSGLG